LGETVTNYRYVKKDITNCFSVDQYSFDPSTLVNQLTVALKVKTPLKVKTCENLSFVTLKRHFTKHFPVIQKKRKKLEIATFT